MKKYERVLWVTGIVVLLISLIYVYDLKQKFQRLFIAGQDQRELIDISIKLLMREQGMSRSEVDKVFIISYSYFSKETCIRFMPRPGVIGGPISYCYDTGSDHRLLRVDKVA